MVEQRASARHFVTRVDTVRSPMERRYFRDIADDQGLDWEYCDRVLADRDIAEYMRRSW